MKLISRHLKVALVLVFMIYVFDVPARGPIFWIIVLTLIQGICGMSFGLVISALCDNEQDAIQVLFSTPEHYLTKNYKGKACGDQLRNV